MIAAQESKLILNLNEIPQAERHSRVFEEFDRLKVDEALEIIVNHEPKLLLKQFKTLREGVYSWQTLESLEGAWRFEILKIKDSYPDQTKVEGCCGSCGSN